MTRKTRNSSKNSECRSLANFRHVPESFARVVAKIGYGHVLCWLDPGDFRPICVPYILGHKRNPSYIVGGTFSIAEPDAGMGYVLRTGMFGGENRMMVIAEIRLYANNHTPTYHVVVGDVAGKDNIAMVSEKFGDGDLTMLQPGMGFPKGCHWMPQRWPLPFWRGLG